MNKKFIVLAIVVAIASFFLSRVIWPDMLGMVGPAPGLIPYFILMSIIESLALGIGVAFAFYELKLLKTDTSRLTLWAYISIVWALVSWWPHDNLHRVIGENFQKLLYLEYGFHATLIIGASILALFFSKRIKNA